MSESTRGYARAIEEGLKNPGRSQPAPKLTAEELAQSRGESEQGLRTIRASDIRPERVSWLWEGRIAAGMLNVLTGAPGVGKSTILYELAALESHKGHNVLLATAEDHFALVVRPRLEAAQADLDRVHLIEAVDGRTPSLPADATELTKKALSVQASLITIDPLVCFLSPGVDTHKDSSIRQALAPLARVAEDTGCAVVVVVHLNKRLSADLFDRMNGSIGLAAAARQVLVAGPDLESGSGHVLAVGKSNVGSIPPAVAYVIESATVKDDNDREMETARVKWLDELDDFDLRSLLDRPPATEQRRAIDDACDFLHSMLAEGPRSAAEVERASREVGISPSTLKRARRHLGVVPTQQHDGKITGWILALPDQEDQPRRGPLGPLAPSCPNGQGSEQADHRLPPPGVSSSTSVAADQSLAPTGAHTGAQEGATPTVAEVR